MIAAVGYRWHLRRVLADKGIFVTSHLQPLLAERGVALSAAQVYRLVTQTPERLSLHTLAALCDILACTPNDLIEPVAQARPQANRAASGQAGRRRSGSEPAPEPEPAAEPAAVPRPKRARILPGS